MKIKLYSCDLDILNITVENKEIADKDLNFLTERFNLTHIDKYKITKKGNIILYGIVSDFY